MVPIAGGICKVLKFLKVQLLYLQKYNLLHVC